MKNVNFDKKVYITEDVDSLNWHDCKIQAIRCDDKEFKLIFDIDYIVQWFLEKETNYYNFYLSPAMLIFNFVGYFDFDIGGYNGFIIDSIKKNGVVNLPINEGVENIEQIRPTQYEWVISLISGEIRFLSSGFEMYLRKKPQIYDAQEISLETRGGISFDATVFE
jgi:hypothetical protein